jgi:GNAT superfamily N-acetyltransferase
VVEDDTPVAAAGAYPVSLVKPANDTGEAAARLAYFAPVQQAMRADAFHISRLGVLDAYRRQGIARTLVEAITDTARDRGNTRLTLFVWEDNTGARAFYDGLGFSQIDQVTLPPHPRATRHGTTLLLEKSL